jgi:hypothetical protein
MIAAAIAADPHSRSKTPFIKLTSGTSVVRLLPSFNDVLLPYRVRVGNRYNTPDGYFRIAMDLEFVVEDEFLLDAALTNDLITNKDVEMVTQYGDPFNKLAKAIKDFDFEDEEEQKKHLRNVRPRKTYLWNAVSRDEGGEQVSVWESSKDLRGKVVALLKTYPELFDPEVGFDIQIIGNGKEGLARRYESVLPMRDPSPVGFNYVPQLVDLDEFNLRTVVGYAEKLRILFQQHAELIEMVGLSLSDFGAE